MTGFNDLSFSSHSSHINLVNPPRIFHIKSQLLLTDINRQEMTDLFMKNYCENVKKYWRKFQFPHPRILWKTIAGRVRNLGWSFDIDFLRIFWKIRLSEKYFRFFLGKFKKNDFSRGKNFEKWKKKSELL